MRPTTSALVAGLALLTNAVGASHLTPPVLPLIVRNPYLSTWLGDARREPWTSWPMFYTGEEIGFSILASIPDTGYVYPLLGRPHDSLSMDGYDGYNVSYPKYLGAQFDASTTNLSYSIPPPKHLGDAGDLEILITFLSPITPTSTLRQSIPAGYVNVEVTGNFDVDIYIDVNGQWVSGDRGSQIVWELQRSGMQSKDSKREKSEIMKTWVVRKETEQLYTERNDRAEWGTLLFSASEDVRHESGTSSRLRSRFSRTGTLQDVVDDGFRSIMDQEPVFAFSKSFSLNTTSADPCQKITKSTLFTIAHIQAPVVQYAAARGLTHMRPLWESWFFSTEALLLFHYLDFPFAAGLAHNYSMQLEKDALKSGASNYRDIVALSARQVMGATSFAGTPDNPILFLKEISSNGNSQTVDVIFPAFPFFLYTNPRWLAYLLEPLIEYMLSGQYPNDYTMHDLGLHFPNMTGHADGNDEYMPVEECGNILIMGLALVNSLIYETPNAGGSIWSSEGSASIAENTASAFPLQALENREGIFGLDDRWGGAENHKGERQARKWINKSYRLWKQWTRYLVDFSLLPATQLSTDDFAGWLANHTNLALKGVIGIRAMSELASIVGNDADAEYYRNISEVYVEKWEEYAVSRDGTHAKLAYTWYGSWTTIYNLFADSLLCFRVGGHENATSLAPSSSTPSLQGDDQKPIKPPGGRKGKQGFVSEHIYKISSDWYYTVRQRYGLPLDSRHTYTKSDWEFFAAAVASKRTRSDILESVALWVNETVTDRPFTDLYETEGRGEFPGITFFARPVVGGHFAFLTLERACGGTAMDGLAFLEEGEAQGVKAEQAQAKAPEHSVVEEQEWVEEL